jgi:hypothetical protein
MQCIACLLPTESKQEPPFLLHCVMLQVTAARCGASPADVLAAMRNAPDAAATTQPADSAGGELLLLPRLVPFSMARAFTPEEGAAYAAAAAAEAIASSLDDDEASDAAAGLGHEGGEGLGAAGAASSKLVGGRVVGRHRLNQRLLVVGLHALPPGWQPGQPLQQDGSTIDASCKHVQEQHSAAAAGEQRPQQMLQQIAGAEVPATPPAHSSSIDSSSSSILAGEDLLLPSWAVASSAAGSSEGAGLGTSRYQLPPVNSDTATHLLQFDGASRGNPGGREVGSRAAAASSTCRTSSARALPRPYVCSLLLLLLPLHSDLVSAPYTCNGSIRHLMSFIFTASSPLY